MWGWESRELKVSQCDRWETEPQGRFLTQVHMALCSRTRVWAQVCSVQKPFSLHHSMPPPKMLAYWFPFSKTRLSLWLTLEDQSWEYVGPRRGLETFSLLLYKLSMPGRKSSLHFPPRHFKEAHQGQLRAIPSPRWKPLSWSDYQRSQEEPVRFGARAVTKPGGKLRSFHKSWPARFPSPVPWGAREGVAEETWQDCMDSAGLLHSSTSQGWGTFQHGLSVVPMEEGNRFWGCFLPPATCRRMLTFPPTLLQIWITWRVFEIQIPNSHCIPKKWVRVLSVLCKDPRDSKGQQIWTLVLFWSSLLCLSLSPFIILSPALLLSMYSP